MYDNGMYVMNKIAGGTVDGEMDFVDVIIEDEGNIIDEVKNLKK